MMKKHSIIEYKHTIHDITSGVNHPKGTPLISVLNEEGMDGWIVCGMIRESVYSGYHTNIYFYRKVIIEEL